MFTTLAFALSFAFQAPMAADHVAISGPAAIVEIDTDKLKGEPARLAWSPDMKQMYLQMVERDGHGNVKAAKHYVVSLDGKSIKGIDQEPPWASKYWMWKSAQMSPAAAAFRIRVEQRTETKRATAAPTGGDLARGANPDPASGSTLSDVASAANQAQIQTIYDLRLGDQLIGEWINEAVAPGTNFGWAPAPAHLIAFARRDGGPLVLLDDGGHKHEIAGTKSISLPAFSDDGMKLAWLTRKDKKHFVLTVGTVEPQ
jgi:hypothetical protein